MSYVGSDGDEDFETVPTNNNYNYDYNVVIYSKSDEEV